MIPPWLRAARSSTPITREAYEDPCHKRLSAELRERLGLPYSRGSKPPARPVDKAGPPKVWLGEAFADYEVDVLAQVIRHDGTTYFAPGSSRSSLKVKVIPILLPLSARNRTAELERIASSEPHRQPS
jgi:hypothetical protein